MWGLLANLPRIAENPRILGRLASRPHVSNFPADPKWNSVELPPLYHAGKCRSRECNRRAERFLIRRVNADEVVEGESVNGRSIMLAWCRSIAAEGLTVEWFARPTLASCGRATPV
jgi:hypothetical protein